MTDDSPTDAGGSPSRDPRKAQLFCPECSYTAPIDGDWLSADDAGARSLRCPACGTVVVRQPAPRLLTP